MDLAIYEKGQEPIDKRLQLNEVNQEIMRIEDRIIELKKNIL